MHKNIQSLFNALDEGLILMSRDGHIRFANVVAKRIVDINSAGKLAYPDISHSLLKVSSGQYHLPLTFDAPPPNAVIRVVRDKLLRLVLMKGVTENEYVLVLRKMYASSATEIALETLGGLLQDRDARLGEDCIHPLDNLLAELRNGNLDKQRISELKENSIRKIRNLAAQIRQTSALLELIPQDSIRLDERINLYELLCNTVHNLDRATKSGIGRIQLQEPDRELAPIYGNAVWLKRAFGELLEHALRTTPQGVDASVSFRQQENFILIVCTQMGRHQLCRGKQSLHPTYGQPSSRNFSHALYSLGLPLARRVIELHGGYLVLSQDLEGFIEFRLELPCSYAVSLSAPDLHAQVERYAADIASLMRLRPPRPLKRENKKTT